MSELVGVEKLAKRVGKTQAKCHVKVAVARAARGCRRAAVELVQDLGALAGRLVEQRVVNVFLVEAGNESLKLGFFLFLLDGVALPQLVVDQRRYIRVLLEELKIFLRIVRVVSGRRRVAELALDALSWPQVPVRHVNLVVEVLFAEFVHHVSNGIVDANHQLVELGAAVLVEREAFAEPASRQQPVLVFFARVVVRVEELRVSIVHYHALLVHLAVERIQQLPNVGLENRINVLLGNIYDVLAFGFALEGQEDACLE